MAYDSVRQRHTALVATKQYLNILYLAARENETAVDDALRRLIETDQIITDQRVSQIIASQQKIPAVTQIDVPAVDLSAYDLLLQEVAQ